MGFLLDPMNLPNSRSSINRWLTRLWVAGLAILLIYLCIQPDIGRLKKHNPTTTALMDLRRQQAHKTKTPYVAVMIWRNIDEISPNLVHAVLISEDDRFYEHHGFDLDEIWE